MSESLEDLRQTLGDATKDMKLNISSVLTNGALEESERYTIAICSALFLKDASLAETLIAEAGDIVTPELIEDAKSAAAIMAMNTVFYRFRHMVGKDSYQQIRAGLRMQRMSKPTSSKRVYELCSMACAVLEGCEACVQSHEASLLKEGLREDQVNDAVRIAAVVSGFQTALLVEKTVPATT